MRVVRVGEWRAFVAAAFLVLIPGGWIQASTSYSSTRVPPSLDFGSVSSSPSGLILSGSATLDGDRGVACLKAKVNPTTLALSGLVEPLCSDTPLLTGHSVAVVQSEAKTMVASVRIVKLTQSGELHIGPVVLTYTVLSDTHLEAVRTSGSLWLYAPNTPSGARALRISESTGKVLQDTPVFPAMDRPVIAANKNGLYLAPASNSGFLGSGLTAKENGIIYHVGIGSQHVQIFDAWSGTSLFPGFISWMAGSGSSLFADICQRPVGTGCVITRFDGTDPKPVFQVSDHRLTTYSVVGDISQGFYGVVTPGYGSGMGVVTGRVVHIDPSNGKISTIAEIPLAKFWQGFSPYSRQAALYGKALYLLVPPGTSSADLPGTLYRIPLSGIA